VATAAFSCAMLLWRARVVMCRGRKEEEEGGERKEERKVFGCRCFLAVVALLFST
jgi:hypothetical protein